MEISIGAYLSTSHFDATTEIKTLIYIIIQGVVL